MYHTEFDPERRILTIRVEGFWTLATVVGFAAKMVATGTALKLKHGDYAVLSDARNFPVQSADVVRTLDVLTAKSLKITAGPTATIVSTMLSKLQADRIMTADNYRVFLDWDEANAWLDQVWVRQRTAA